MQKLLSTYAFIALGLTNASIVLAQTTQQSSHPFAPGSCGPADVNYIRVAEDTGGVPFFFQRSEVAQSTKLMLANSSQNHVTLLWAKGELKNNFSEFFVPVDRTLEYIIFTLSTDARDSKMEVRGPTGAPVTENPRAETSDFTCGHYIILRQPLPGGYRMRITSSGRFWASVVGKSEIFLHGVEFVEPGGRPGHEGMFPIDGEPLAGKPAHLQASVAGEVNTISFALVTPENRPIRSVKLTPVQGDEQDFAGDFSLPGEPFRLLVSGTDQNGTPFQRVHERLFRPTAISLVLVDDGDLPTGVTSALTFQATNLGNADRFRLLAVCANRWPTQVDRTDLWLDHGETAKLVVTVSVPPGTPAYSGGDLVLTASGVNHPSNTNGVVYHLSIHPRTNETR